MVKTLTYEGFQVVVGQSADENDTLLRQAHQNDWWFHASKLPSAHVWLRLNENFELTPSMVYTCADLVKKHCKKAGSSLKVDYLQRKNLTKTRDCKPGEVIMKCSPLHI